MANKPRIIEGKLFIDDRGELSFFNDFEFDSIKRMYIVSNHQSHFVRAWHGHKNESKFITVIKGSAIIGAVIVNDWDEPSKKVKVYREVLSEKNPAIFYIPAGYANGFMNIEKDTKLLIFSTSSLEDSKDDDYRYEWNYWNIWEIEQR